MHCFDPHCQRRNRLPYWGLAAILLALAFLLGVGLESAKPQGINCIGSSWVVSQAPAVAAPKMSIRQPPPPLVVPALDGPAKYEWHKATESQHWLLKDGICVGEWYEPDQMFYSWDGAKSGPACKPPIDPPGHGFEAMGPMAAWKMKGISIEKLRGHDKEVVSFGGKRIEPHQLHDAFEGKLTDDSSKGYLVIWAKDKAKRDAVYAEWNKLPTDFTSRYNVWMAPPDHFSLQDRFAGKSRFITEGDPTIILQKPNGEVLFRRPQAGQVYKPKDFGDLLKADPDYKGDKDPGGPQPVPPATPHFSIGDIPVVGWVAGGVVLLLVLRRKS